MAISIHKLSKSLRLEKILLKKRKELTGVLLKPSRLLLLLTKDTTSEFLGKMLKEALFRIDMLTSFTKIKMVITVLSAIQLAALKAVPAIL